jgi:transketolase
MLPSTKRSRSADERTGPGIRPRLGSLCGHDWPGVGMETFGASAPLKELQWKFGFTPEAIVAAAKAQVAQAR